MLLPSELGPKIAAGRTADIFAWGDSQVVKLYQDWMPADAADDEAAITQAVQALGVPAARCLGAVDVDGRRGLVFERLAGPPLLEVLLSDPGQTKEIARQLAGLHARLHGANASAAALPRFKNRLAQSLARLNPLQRRWRDLALERLHCLPYGEALCHGDFHPGNVLLTDAGPVVIDWIEASHGNPLADVARTVVLIRYGETPDDPSATAIIDRLRAEFLEAYLAGYRALASAPEADLAAWLPVVMAARLAEGAERDPTGLLSDLGAALGPAA